MSASPNQYVTLVSGGGTPVRLSDQRGSPYPTTGNGALVFSNNPTISNPHYSGVFVYDKGTAIDPIIAFAPVTDKDGFFSREAGHVNVTIDGVEKADFNTAGLVIAGNVSATNIIYSGTLTGAYHSPLTTNGDIYYRAAGVDARLPLGAAGTMLFSSGTAAQWSPVGDIVPIDDYLPLAGGTLVGNLIGTTATFSGLVKALSPTYPSNTTDVATTEYVTTAIGSSPAGTVTGVSVVSANGLAGTVTATATPAITLTTTINGMVRGNATALSAATAGTDYVAPAGLTAALADYLLKTGGTLTGGLTGTTATFTGTVTYPGALLQAVSTQTGAANTGTTIMPDDNTIPQITEGTEFMTLAITPKSATSKLIITVTAMLACNTDGFAVSCALFRDAVAAALAAWQAPYTPTANTYRGTTFTHTMTSGTTSAITFRFRAGAGAASTTVFNGLYGGATASSIVIQEVAV